MTKAVLQVCSCGLLLVAVWSLQGCGSGTNTTTLGPFLYASNSMAPGSMAAFNAHNTGTVAPLSGSPFPSGGNPLLTIGIANKKFLYAAVPASTGVPGGIVMFPIQAGTTTLGMTSGSAGTLGAVQTVASGTAAAPLDFDGLAVTPNGNFLYTADVASSHVFAFSIDSSSGALKAIGPAGGIAVNADPLNVRVDPQGKFLFVASCDCTTPHAPSQGVVTVFSIDSSTGNLTQVGGPYVPTGGGAGGPRPIDVVVSPDGKFLYIASQEDVNTPSDLDRVYTANIAASGALSSAGAPATLPASSVPSSIAVTTDGKFVYTADLGTNAISLLTVGSTNMVLNGVLTYQGPDFTNAGQPVTLLADTRGGILYAADIQGGRVIVLSIGTSGVLTLSGSPINTSGIGAFGLAMFTP
jgi:6-phosphogluconolactonase